MLQVTHVPLSTQNTPKSTFAVTVRSHLGVTSAQLISVPEDASVGCPLLLGPIHQPPTKRALGASQEPHLKCLFVCFEQFSESFIVPLPGRVVHCRCSLALSAIRIECLLPQSARHCHGKRPARLPETRPSRPSHPMDPRKPCSVLETWATCPSFES
jgi:hypothetical protein